MTTVAKMAEQFPDRPAVIFGNGEFTETYSELEERSRQIAAALQKTGIQHADGVAVLIPNVNEFYDLFWASNRLGLYFTPVNWHLQYDEIQYIVDNCDASVFVASAELEEVALKVAKNSPKVKTLISVGGEIPGFTTLESFIADTPADADLGEEFEGTTMLYSSGTTGQPKGVRRKLTKVPAGDPKSILAGLGLLGLFGVGEDDVYLSPAPLYHAAPLGFSTAMHRIGATVVVMRRFDAEEAIRLIQDQKVTASQWVPTHFRRLLQVPEDVRKQYDVSSLRIAIHAAAPCPIPIKEQMIEWWGDAIFEYYAGTEGGGTLIRSSEWMEHKGSVGRHWSGGTIHLLDEDGNEIQKPNTEGAIYFEAPPDAAARFQYHKDPDKTKNTYRGDLFTIGDIGYLDEDGYLYLTDRQSNMIISGGVNIYPQETENHLIVHPKVDDVAVIGVPNEEMGEEVKAVVVPAAGVDAGPDLEVELIKFCRDNIAHYKCPRSIDFATEVPRTETGKMAKRRLRAKYWEGRENRLV